MKLVKILNNHEDGLMFVSYLFGRLAAFNDAEPEEVIDQFLNHNPDIKERVNEAINSRD